jgi:hypothetical protein
VFDAPNTELVSTGHTDTRDETLDHGRAPHPKDCSPLSRRAPISVEGTLAEPEAFPHPADIGGVITASTTPIRRTRPG